MLPSPQPRRFQKQRSLPSIRTPAAPQQQGRLFLFTIFLRPFSRTTIMESSPRPASQILLLTILVRHNLLLTILVSHIFTSAWTANLVCYNRV